MMEGGAVVPVADDVHSHTFITPNSSTVEASIDDDRVYCTVFHFVNKAKEEVEVLADGGSRSGPVVDADAAAATGFQRPGPVYSDAQVAAEVLWLHRYTSDGSSWRSIRDRVSQTRTAAQKRVRKNRSGLVHRFLSNLPSPRHSAAQQRDAVVAEVGRSLLQHCVDESILALCNELVDGVYRAWGLVISAIVPVAAGISDRNARFSRISGREHLTQGLLSDCRYEHGPPPQDGDDDVRITMPMLKKASPSQPAPAPVPTVSLDGDAWMPGQALRQVEADYWMRETAVSPIAGGSLQCPPGCGFPTAVRLFTPCSAAPSSSSSGRAAAGRMGRRGASSVLVCGTSLGVMVFWSMPLLLGEAATLLAVGTPDDLSTASAIVDIQGGTVGLSQFVSTSAGGGVQVWHLNDTPDSGSNDGWRSGPQRQYVRSVSNVLSLGRNDLLAALPTVRTKQQQLKVSIDHDLMAYSDADYTDQQEVDLLSCERRGDAEDMTTMSLSLAMPCVACFHPAMTLLGRNVSVLVGTTGGDIVKFNMDYTSLTGMQGAEVVFPARPFVDREMLHPSEGPEGFLLTGCVEQKRVLKGNRVYREVFRGGHRCHRVLAMGVLGGLSDTMLSVDRSGTICEWKYGPELFKAGNHWFIPSRVTRVQLLRKRDLLPFDLSTCALSALPCTYSYSKNGIHQPGNHKTYGESHVGEDAHAASKVTQREGPERATSSPKGFDDDVSRSTDDDAKGLTGGGRVSDDASTGVSPVERRDMPPHLLPPPTAEQRGGLRAMETCSGGTADHPLLRTVYHPMYSPPHQCWIQHCSSSRGDEGSSCEGEQWEGAQTLREVHLDLSVVSCKLSSDGDELFMLLGARCSTGGQQVVGAAQGSDDDAVIVVYYLAPYLVERRGFRPPFCRLLFRGDSSPAPFVRDFCVGPVTLETLTRMCFVLTPSRVEVFGAYTGLRLHSIEWTHMTSFSPDRISVCPSQQWLAVSAGGDDPRIAVWTISRISSCSQRQSPSTGSPSSRADILRRCAALFSEDSSSLFDFRSIAQHATQTALFASSSSSSGSVDNPYRLSQKVNGTSAAANRLMDHDWIVRHVWDAVTEAIDRLERHRHLSRLVASSLSSSIGGEAAAAGRLGTIEPTTWPGPQHPQWSSVPAALDNRDGSSLEIHSARDNDNDDDTLEAAPLMLKTARIAKEVRRGSILWRKKVVKGNEREGTPQKNINRLSINSLISKVEERTSSDGEDKQVAVQGGGQATSRRAVKGEEEESFV